MLRLPLVAALAMALATPAFANPNRPTVGFGLTIAFGAGGADTGVGLRVFSGNRQNRAVGSLGVDYMFGSQGLRGSVGVGYLGRNVYGGADIGLNFNQGTPDFGLNLGVTNTRRP